MTPNDYEFLRKTLKERSGLVLSDDKQYLVESRLLPVARKFGLGGLDELVAALRLADGEALTTAVVEAMMTNETFFFRDKTPFEHFRATVMPALSRFAAPRLFIDQPYVVAVDLRNHQRHVGLHAQRTRVGDDRAARVGELRFQFAGDRGIERGEDNLRCARGLGGRNRHLRHGSGDGSFQTPARRFSIRPPL